MSGYVARLTGCRVSSSLSSVVGRRSAHSQRMRGRKRRRMWSTPSAAPSTK
jgi:hypothetical protein